MSFARVPHAAGVDEHQGAAALILDNILYIHNWTQGNPKESMSELVLRQVSVVSCNWPSP